MKNVASITSLLLAYAIILLHAVVPHHHHDCYEAMGIVFEDELSCCCDDHPLDTLPHDHSRNSHHPFDSCKLQDLLSQLVISNRDDKIIFTVPHELASSTLMAPLLDASCILPPRSSLPFLSPHALPPQLPLSSCLRVAPLRAPPCLALA